MGLLGKRNPKMCAVIGRLAEDFSVMRSDDIACDRKSHSGAAAVAFGREKRVKYPVCVACRNAGAIVRNMDVEVGRCFLSRKGDLRGVLLKRVLDHLLQNDVHPVGR